MIADLTKTRLRAVCKLLVKETEENGLWNIGSRTIEVTVPLWPQLRHHDPGTTSTGPHGWWVTICINPSDAAKTPVHPSSFQGHGYYFCYYLSNQTFLKASFPTGY